MTKRNGRAYLLVILPKLTADRPTLEGEATTPTDEIEVTTAMVIAGFVELHAPRNFEHDEQVIVRIYRAMELARKHAMFRVRNGG